VIRSDCSGCQFSFHIIAHEQTHLRLNSLDEALVEEETLKQTKHKLIPLLLSNQKYARIAHSGGARCIAQRQMSVLKKQNNEQYPK
jgi:hypothetical protein